MQIHTNASAELRIANEILDVFSKIEEKAAHLKGVLGFYTVDDVVELTKMSEPQVLKIFNRKDFPLCDYGRSYIVAIPAFWEYFMKAVKQDDIQ